MVNSIPMKTVLMPIQVPDTDYCWDGHTPCEHFDNTGGHGRCILGIDGVDRDQNGLYPKPTQCANFKDQSDE